MTTDEQLIEQIKRGGREVYGQLFSKYYERIYKICLSILKNPQDAEEVAQETFVHGYLKLDQLKNPDKFFAWLKRIAQNRSIKYLHRKRREIVRAGVVTLPQVAPDELLLRQELIDAIMEAIESLPEKDREVIQSRIEGLNHSEISERFGISIEASMSRLYRSRKKITAYVKDLLYAISAFPKIFPLKKIVSGGIIAMKVSVSAKYAVIVSRGILIELRKTIDCRCSMQKNRRCRRKFRTN